MLQKNFRIYGTLDNPLFLAKDVAEWIEHSNPSKLIKDAELGEEEVEKHIISTLTNSYSALFLTEDGLYEDIAHTDECDEFNFLYIRLF